MAEPLPSYAMPEKKPARSRRGLVVVVLAGILIFLFLDKDSSLYGFISGDIPLTWDNLFLAFREYGNGLFSFYLVVIGAALFLENRNPDRTLAWLLALALLPVVGLVLYWIVGPNFRYLANKRRFRLPKLCEVTGDLSISQFPPLVTATMQLLYRSSGARLVTGTNVRPLYDGTSAFARMKECLENAQRGILLESYIIKNDRLGNEIKDILIERAGKGVSVCVIYDAVGSWRMGKKYIKALRDGGVRAFAFLPVSFPMFRGANYRNHRKILIVDGSVAFVGGMNIGDEYVGNDARYTSWRDIHLEFGGQGVEVLRGIFFGDLTICGAPANVIAAMREATDPVADPVLHRQESLVLEALPSETPMQIVASGPNTPWDTIQKAYFSVITRAREKLWLTTPYLVPGGSLLESLCLASLSGVDVRILLPGKTDNPLAQWANRDCFDELLRAGVRIFLYDPTGFVHSKSIICDGTILSIGSANMDARSLHINFEVQAFLYDRGLAAEAEKSFENDTHRCFELTFNAWRKRPKTEKIKESVGKLFSSLL